MDEDRNLVEKGTFQGQTVCSEITESHGGFFKTGTPAFCSESIVFLEKLKRRKNIYQKKCQTSIDK